MIISTFNPIKVLFLRCYSAVCYLNAVSFQSYQGSIFTNLVGLPEYVLFSFQSYQGSIFTSTSQLLSIIPYAFNPIKVLFLPISIFSQSIFHHISFNPIKVLFLLDSSPCLVHQGSVLFQSYQGSIFTYMNDAQGEIGSSFQSYQGSIFTFRVLEKIGGINGLSILSRFYFYNSNPQHYPTRELLSILSRFYFYNSNPQHYPTRELLSILSRFYFYFEFNPDSYTSTVAFNPIKVLFLHI